MAAWASVCIGVRRWCNGEGEGDDSGQASEGGGGRGALPESPRDGPSGVAHSQAHWRLLNVCVFVSNRLRALRERFRRVRY